MTDLTARRTALLAYAQSCLASEDWHGLRDAAADLEVIEARLEERAGRIELVKPNLICTAGLYAYQECLRAGLPLCIYCTAEKASRLAQQTAEG